ncbi:MAG: transposase [Candidatus Entotheonellia bacterium]
MPQPPHDVDTLFEDLLQDLPPETVSMAREFKAFTRARKVKTPVQLLRLVLLYGGLDKSLREVAGNYTLLVEAITDSSVAERLAACRPWVRALLARMVSPPTTLPAQRRFLVIDGSGIQAPGARGTQYRLHLCMDLVTLTFVSITVTDKHTGESLRHFPLGPGDVAVADRGYGHPATLVQTVQQGADLLVRLNAHNVPVTQPDGTPLDWGRALGHQVPTSVCTLPVQLAVAGAEPLPLWVHAYRLPEAQANKARRVCRQQSRKKGHQPTQQSLLLAGWVLVVTTLPPTLLPGSTALALYRVRWQIEIAIKRWKSVLDVDLLRARYESPLAEVWVHGKLLYVLLLDRRRRRTLGEQWSWLDRVRTATWWRPWKLLRDEVAPRMTGLLGCQDLQWARCLQVLAERPRRRQLQRLPQEVIYAFALSAPPRQPAPQQEIAA